MTVLEVLRAAASYLGAKGVESPRLNAEHLLAKVLGVRRLDLYLAFDRPLSEPERAPLRELVRQRAEGRPLQHLLGNVEFMGREFRCDARALIPRPETEQLAALLLEHTTESARNVFDAGTGSGVLAITLALERPCWRVMASDLSPSALELARENAESLGAKVEFFLADLLPPEIPPLHVLVANLPYIPTAELAHLPREVQADPPEALDGGEDGLRIIARLIEKAPGALAPGGRLALEVGEGQAQEVCALLGRADFRDICVQADYQGKMRFVFASHG